MREIALARPCVVCDSSERVHELRVEEWDVERCAGCGARTLSPEPDHVKMEEFDDGSGYDSAFALRDDLMARHRVSLASLERFAAVGTLLDVGCGPAFLLEAARERGWDATGVDPSPFSAEHARGLGFAAYEGLLENLRLEAGSFDAIALLQVVEHLPDPRSLLAECKRLLRPGGALLVATPNPASLLARVKRERFNYWIPPMHCAWYTPASLQRLLQKAGFAIKHSETWSARTPRLHDGTDIVASTKIGARLPLRARRIAGDAVAALSDRLGSGSIVEIVAVKA